MTIASPQNEKLKLVRKLRERKHREREGLFVERGRGPGRGGAGGWRRAAPAAECRRLRPRRTLGRRGGRAGAARLGRRARLGDAGDRDLAAGLGRAADGALRLPARGRRPRQRRRDPPQRPRPARRHGRARPWVRRPVLAEGGAGQHGLGLRAAARPGRGGGDAGAAGGAGRPRRRWPRGAGRGGDALPRRRARGAACAGAGRVARSRRRFRCGRAAPSRSTSPPRRRSPASGYRRPRCRRRGPMLERIEEIRSEAASAIGAAASTAELEELRVRHLGRKAELTHDPARDRRAAGGGTRQSRRRRQQGAPGAGGAARGRAPRGSTPLSSTPSSPPTGSTSPCLGRRRVRSATRT